MQKKNIYIDGSSGTTGLRINQILKNHDKVSIIKIDEKYRKNEKYRLDAIKNSDLSILCLPDKESAHIAQLFNDGDKIIDTSTYHRVNSSWIYGLAEMQVDQREKISKSNLVANPGCYPTGIILAIKPLVDNHIISSSYPLSIHALSGYSGGGKKLIEKWESNAYKSVKFESPYALLDKHKHLEEIKYYTNLDDYPHFIPSVGAFFNGMRIEISIHKNNLLGLINPKNLFEILTMTYEDENNIVISLYDNDSFYDDFSFSPEKNNNTNKVTISIIPNKLGHISLIIQLDNLGKGASGAAVQNMNLMLDLDENTGINS
ncbi:MAG: N-acetyl-gamma-glutamyl-phosphate reductase [SAR202 cluster bacterium]|nr:N-acetyl-gamma-glutamyl-phosphate reductase [SAR202 cluster bacterium]|tara:strand:+ start:2895 stop:3845 length:951 start_codon:yes stop_codon:yes gene_type:complete